MKANELGRWVDNARAQKATRIIVRRARSRGALGEVFGEFDVEGLDVTSLLERMQEDIVQNRLPGRTFELAAYVGEATTPAMRERLTLNATEAIEGVDMPPELDPRERVWMQQTERAYRLMAESMQKQSEGQLGVIDSLAARLVDVHEKTGNVLSQAFDLATLSHERELEANRSAERREVIKSGISELGPLVAMAIARFSKDQGNRFAVLMSSFFSSLSEDQMTGIMQTLRPEQIANLGELSDLVKKKGDAKQANGAADAPKGEAAKP